MSAKQEALRLIRAANGHFDDHSERRTQLLGCAWAPPGAVWRATGCHGLVVNFHTNRPAGWEALLEDLRKGTVPCDVPDCYGCEEDDGPCNCMLCNELGADTAER